MSDHAPITVVNVISTVFSGSTWLSLMLGTHPRMLNVGEMRKIRYDDNQGNCALHGRECPLWSRFDWHAEENPYHQIARLSGYRTIVVDNSRKLLPAQRAAGARIRFIHLIRDGRAVTASMLRKNWKGRMTSIGRAARRWRHDLRRNRKLMKQQPEADQIAVRYEDLLADKPGELSRICAFLGLEYDPAMCEFWAGDHHPLGGNPGTLSSMLRRHDSAREDRAESFARSGAHRGWDMDYYQQQDPQRFRDERWKNELRDRDLRIFGLIAGRLNRCYGYPKSLDRRDLHQC